MYFSLTSFRIRDKNLYSVYEMYAMHDGIGIVTLDNLIKQTNERTNERTQTFGVL